MVGNTSPLVLSAAFPSYFKLKEKELGYFEGEFSWWALVVFLGFFFCLHLLVLHPFLAAWQLREYHNVTDCVSEIIV